MGGWWSAVGACRLVLGVGRWSVVSGRSLAVRGRCKHWCRCKSRCRCSGLGARCWVLGEGAGAGAGSIVGAGSVVTKSTQPYSINVGNPSKPIKSRFDDCTINDLIESKWWTLETDRILPYLDMSPSLFLRSLSS